MTVTFTTIADARFAPGAVAMVNSLRLQGHDDPVTILDVGLRAAQRATLGATATLLPWDRSLATNPTLFKPFAHLVKPEGVVVIVDADQIVTRSLTPVIEAARDGAICAFPDPEAQRWFAEWDGLFELRSPLRRGTYVNAGFIALSVDHWPWLLERWWELCERIWHAPTIYERSDDAPDAQGDQDALNALLMSEVPPGAVTLLDPDLAPAADALARGVDVVDVRTLACSYAGKPTYLLHAAGAAKPWLARDWAHVRGTAYDRLLRRLLAADDVRVRLPASDLPPWLRRGRLGAASYGFLRLTMGVAWRIGRLPVVRPVSQRVLRALGRRPPVPDVNAAAERG